MVHEPPEEGETENIVEGFEAENGDLPFDHDAFQDALDTGDDPPRRGEMGQALCAGAAQNGCPQDADPSEQYQWLYDNDITALTPEEFEDRATEETTTGQLASFLYRLADEFSDPGYAPPGGYAPDPGVVNDPANPCQAGYSVIQAHVSATDDGCRPQQCDFGRGADGWCLPPSNTDPPLIYVLGDTVAEDSGPAQFRLRLSHAVAQPVSVRVDTVDGTATSGSDYTTVGRTVTFAALSVVEFVDVAVRDDTAHEPDEDFSMQLSSPSTNAELSTTLSADAVIVDDEIAPPGAVQNLALACAGPDAFGEFTLTATWDPPPDGAVRVQVEITDQANVNLYAISAGGTSPYTATVTAEGTYRVGTLPYLTGGLQGQTSEAFVECPTLPEVSVAASADVREGVALEFTVSLSAPSATDVTVETVAVGITATEGIDFLTRSGTVTIPAGATSKDVFVFSVADLDVELDETLRLELSSPAGALPSAAMTATGRILDDDDPAVSLPSAPLSVTEGSSVQVTATLDQTPVSTGSVQFTTSGAVGGASSCGVGDDYAVSGSLFSFAAGVTTASVTLTACDDDDAIHETVTLTLVAAGISELQLGTPTNVDITIDDTSLTPLQRCAALHGPGWAPVLHPGGTPWTDPNGQIICAQPH